MDKIYSRKRIKFPKIKHKKIKKIRVTIYLMIVIIIIILGYFIYASYPIFIASCKTAASSKAVSIANEEVKNVMNNYTYNDLIDIEKDDEGNVTLIKANTILLNKVTSEIAENIQKQIDDAPTIMVYINLGSVSGISVLKNIEPKFDIELEEAGKIQMQTKSEFQTAGVNQTLHKIYLEINTSISILTPLGVYEEDILSKALLTETVIVGDVPSTYYNFKGMEEEQVLNVLE